ncbi:MAG: DUF4190 domain-containing protein [Solirubrobacterales bacterium]|nr:DUF4190 domain-containing protein [Solirubrobacterales bacterium]
MNDQEQAPPAPVFVPAGAQPPPGYVPYYPVPAVPLKKPNGNATASLIISGGSLAALIFTIGFFAPLTLITSIVGTVLGHKAKSATDRDPEVGQRDEAIAGFWMGIGGIILSVLAIAFWVVVILVMVAADPNSSFDSDLFVDDPRLD